MEHYEDICDEMEVDIANYLNKVSTEEPSADLKRAICGMLREVAEIESIGDSCHHIAHTARRNYRSTQQLTEKQLEHIHQMFQLTEQHWNKCEPSYPSGKPQERLPQPTI